MYKKFTIFTIILSLLFTYPAFGEVIAPEPDAAQAFATAVGDDLPVSRALVAKMLSLAHNDLNAIITYDREISFSDTSYEKWYDKFINAAFISGLMQGTDGKFMPEQPITLRQSQILLDSLDPKNPVKIKITDETANKPISYALWVTLYKKHLENISGDKKLKDVFNIDERVFVVLATPDNNNKLTGFNMITDKGPVTYEGLNMKPYIDKSIRVLQKDGDVIAILAIEDNSPTIENAYIVNADTTSITIFSGGAERAYKYTKSPQNSAGKICDITINGENASKVVLYEPKMNDVVKMTNQKEIEFENKGTIPYSENIKVYSTSSGNVKWKALKDWVVGYDLGDFILKDGKIIAAVMKKAPPTDKMRVAININGFKGLNHDNVTFTSSGKFTMKIGSKAKTFNPGETLDVKKELGSSKTRMYISPVSTGGTIAISSIKREWPQNQSPAFRGVFEVSRNENGKYNVVNEVNIDDYLYGVVPSEMLTAYGVEAAKVQAVTARSYAKNQILANRFHQYGATVDDSVSSQVYLRIPETDVSIKAVNETKGQCLTYKGEPISANFFSTSSGVTANGGEVWADSVTKQFPTVTHEYLKSVKQFEGDKYGDLSKEENAAAFFKAKDINAFDSSFPWFRWSVTMTGAEIAATINATIKGRYDISPQLIKTLQPNNTYRSRPISTIGDLVDLEVTKRGESGNIMEMKVTGTKATVKIMTEYNVRALIKPSQQIKGAKPIVTTKKDGSTNNNYSIMPSAFYTMDKKTNGNGVVTSVTFYGGGNGHGAGMSQNGVKGMIDKGYTFEKILQHYYPGTEISNLQ